MYIDKFKKGEYWVDKDGCQYDSADDFIQSSVMGFCGCGDQEASLTHLMDALRVVDNLKKFVWEDKQTWEDWESESKTILGGLNSMYFMWYYLDKMQLTEHGGSVPGWLTVEGEELLKDLDEILCPKSE